MNNRNEIKNIISKLSIMSLDEISDEDSLISIGIDSLKIVELIVMLEDDLELTFDDSDLDPTQLSTVGSIVELAEKYLNI